MLFQTHFVIGLIQHSQVVRDLSLVVAWLHFLSIDPFVLEVLTLVLIYRQYLFAYKLAAPSQFRVLNHTPPSHPQPLIHNFIRHIHPISHTLTPFPNQSLPIHQLVECETVHWHVHSLANGILVLFKRLQVSTWSVIRLVGSLLRYRFHVQVFESTFISLVQCLGCTL